MSSDDGDIKNGGHNLHSRSKDNHFRSNAKLVFFFFLLLFHFGILSQILVLKFLQIMSNTLPQNENI
jgi:hypothetical protein